MNGELQNNESVRYCVRTCETTMKILREVGVDRRRMWLIARERALALGKMPFTLMTAAERAELITRRGLGHGKQTVTPDDL